LILRHGAPTLPSRIWELHSVEDSHMASRTFFITGVSTGLGKALATEALNLGHRVVGTVREEAARSAFDRIKPGSSYGKLLDVTDVTRVTNVISEVESGIGPIDVAVNNAGYGQEGTIEESSLDEMRRQFEVNVFGVVAVIKAVLPFMRARRKGHIINVSSQGGLVTFPGVGYYHGSKFALEGISGALRQEVKDFGIAVTAVEPGMFRTDWAGRSLVRSARTVADYDKLFEPLRAARLANSGHQAGDPLKAARAILKVVESPNPPAHLLLGPDALKNVRANLKSFEQEIKEWEAVSASTNFD
jgi:NAD(P)-dependent dehydrogenase (short-subunit alcohol dehydrogenase family)